MTSIVAEQDGYSNPDLLDFRLGANGPRTQIGSKINSGMISITHLQSENLPIVPRRVLKYLLVYCHQGNLRMQIDEMEYALAAGQAVTITSGQIHAFTALEGCALLLDFTLDFFCKDDDDMELVFHNGLFCHFGMNEVIPVRDAAYFQSILEQIETELAQQPYQYLISVRSHVELLLVELNRSNIELGKEIWKPDALFLHFLELVRENYRQQPAVKDYAARLGATEAKLNELSKLHTGKTAQNVVFSLTISEAKRLLRYHDLSVKEVASQLGFSDPFYFSNFFKKHTGVAPAVFKTVQPR